MRQEKQAIVDEIRTEVSGSHFLLLAEYRGMNVEHFNDLRSQLCKAGSRVMVVKNRFLKHVISERGWADGVAPLLRGQSAMVTGRDVVQTAKVLKQFSSANQVPVIKGGMMGERFLSSGEVAALADMPPREVLLGMVVGTVAAPLSRLVGVLKQKLTSVIYVLKAIEEKKSAK
jgi:large subunit ribosomal protein L10